jgi:hypothetical protein
MAMSHIFIVMLPHSSRRPSMPLTATLLVSPLGHSRVHAACHPEATGAALRGRRRLAAWARGLGACSKGATPSRESVLT